MVNGPRDLAQIRFDNAMRLFDEFVSATVKHADAATLRGLEGRFAERLQIQPSYWSQIKGRSRQIGERLARQFEQQCRKPTGWMDDARDGMASAREAPAHAPVDDDERFIVGLVLTYYRRHPERARARLLDLLGEVLQPPAPGPTPVATPARKVTAGSDSLLWSQARTAVAPLKRKR
jgi:hypothetical protein